MFAKTKGVKNPCSIKYLVEEAWGMGPKYVPCLLKQLCNVFIGSDVDKYIMDHMISITATYESGEKVHVSVIDIIEVAKKFFTLARIYAIHTSRPETYKGGEFEPTYEECSKGLACSTSISVLMKGYTDLCGDDKIYWESKCLEWLAQRKGWNLEPQAPQMPHKNVLDLLVFP